MVKVYLNVKTKTRSTLALVLEISKSFFFFVVKHRISHLTWTIYLPYLICSEYPKLSNLIWQNNYVNHIEKIDINVWNKILIYIIAIP